MIEGRPIPMSSVSNSVYDVCLQEALVRSQEWVPRWLAGLSQNLRSNEVTAVNAQDKHTYHTARKALESFGDLIAARFIETLAQSLPSHDGGPQGATMQRPMSLDRLSLDDLELMDDDQVHEKVEQGRVLQIVKMAVDEELVAFNSLLCGAQGQAIVRADANPLRPEVIVQTLMRALETLHVDPAIRSSWLHGGAVVLGQEIQQLYRDLSAWLSRQGVQPAGYVVTQTAMTKSVSSRAAGAPRRAPSAPQGEQGLLTLDHLHRLLVGNLDEKDNPATGTGHAGAGAEMVNSLAAEVVTLMLRNITEDVRLLPKVRAMLGSLKPTLLQMARDEPRFFADRQNPARRLLETITERGLAFTSEQDEGFSDYAKLVRQSVKVLQQEGPDLASRLEQQLMRLGQVASPTRTPARGIAVQTLVKVEQRNLLAQRVATEIEARNDFARAPGVVRRFLTGPWSQVVAQARLEASATGLDMPGDAPAMRYMAILPDLLWSSQLALASRNRPRLVKLIPQLLRTLREGLASIDYPQAQAETFFQALMGLHEAAYKAQQPLTESEPSRFEPDEDDAWLRPAEAKDTGFIDDLGVVPTQPAFENTQPLQRDWHDIQQENAGRSRLPLEVGTWVDLWRDEGALRCQLTWASPHGTMFLFNSADGRSVSLTQRGLIHTLESGRLRVVAQHGMVDDALDAVARQAWINSLKA